MFVPGARSCITAVNWLRAHEDGAAAFVVLASTHGRALTAPLTTTVAPLVRVMRVAAM